MKSLDILLATYNGEKFLAEQVESIVSQLGSANIQARIIVRDDGSTDKTKEILESYVSKYPTILKIIPNNERKPLGACGNFSKLLTYSSADYIMFSDQDDIWLPYKIDLEIKKIGELESIYGENMPVLVHTDLAVVRKDLSPICHSLWKYQGITPYADWRRLLVQNVVTGCTMVINRALRNVVLPIPEEAIMHDWWIALVASFLGKVEAISKPTVLYRQHEHNDTGAKKWGMQTILGYLGSGLKTARRSLRKTQLQAVALASHLREILPSELEEIRVIERYGHIDRLSWLKRRSFILENKILKYGVVRNIALLSLI